MAGNQQKAGIYFPVVDVTSAQLRVVGAKLSFLPVNQN